MLNLRKEIFCALGLIGILAAGSASAETMYICANKKTGTITVRSFCLKSETKVRNINALTGDQGEQGEQGPQGPQGTTGPQGPAGLSGGTIIGHYQPVPAGCFWQPQTGGSVMHGTIGVAGTSYVSNFAANGNFAIYNVKAGTYTLTLLSVSNTSFFGAISSQPGFGTQLATNVVVTEGQTVDVGTVTDGTSCCGNSYIDAGETCDTYNTAGATCEGLGLPAGALRCNYTCDGLDTSSCT